MDRLHKQRLSKEGDKKIFKIGKYTCSTENERNGI